MCHADKFPLCHRIHKGQMIRNMRVLCCVGWVKGEYIVVPGCLQTNLLNFADKSCCCRSAQETGETSSPPTHTHPHSGVFRGFIVFITTFYDMETGRRRRRTRMISCNVGYLCDGLMCMSCVNHQHLEKTASVVVHQASLLWSLTG